MHFYALHCRDLFKLVLVTALPLFLAATCAISAVMAAEGEKPMLYPISIEGKWGYIDADGKVVIEPQFLGASHFSEGLAVVTVAGKSEEDLVFERKYQGYIDPDGKFVIPPQPPPEALKIKNYDCYSYGDFHEGLARIHVNDSSGMDGFIDRTGKVVIPLKFDSGSEFSEGLVFASTWRHWNDPGPKKAGFIDKQGRFVIRNDSFGFSHSFLDDRAVVSVRADNDQWACGLIDKAGKFVILPGKYTALTSCVGGAIRAVNDGKVGLLDSNGKIIVPLGEYDQILEPTNGDVFTAETGGKTVLINAAGQRLAEVAEPGDVSRFSHGLAAIKQGDRYGYIDTTGAIRIPPQFDGAEAFEGALALVKLSPLKGYINSEGRLVWKTDRWDEPLRNAVSKPLSTFLPESTVEALPLSYNWERVKNAIVFVADGSLDDLRAWYKKRCADKLELHDHTNYELEPDKVDLSIFRPDAGSLEVYAIAGSASKETADGFTSFYFCKNMDKLRKKYPKKIIGILIEN